MPPTAVSLIAVTADGERVRWFKADGPKICALGARRGTVFTARAGEGSAIHLTEGEVDALALACQGFEGVVRTTGGTSGFGVEAVADPIARPVVLYPDGDRGGFVAAAKAQAGILATGRACRIAWRAIGSGDPADDLATAVAERAALRAEADEDRTNALSGAWHDFLLREIRTMILLRKALEDWRQASEAGERKAMDAAAREVLHAATAPESATGQEVLRTAFAAAVAEALVTDDETRAREALHALNPEQRAALLEEPLALPAVAEWANQSEPAPVLWREPTEPDAEQATERADAVLSMGECAILAAPGGTGKSYLALALAIAATAANGAHYGSACGLRVRPGPVVLVSYEDSPVRMYARLRAIAGRAPSRAIHCWPDPAPLFIAGEGPGRGEARPLGHWASLWAAVRTINPTLVVIDPVSAALEGASMSEGSPVRAFMRELAREASAAKAGVLLVAHDTKAARDLVRAGEDPGAGAVAGSATWYDAARSVLYMARDGDKRSLKCIKANYGRSGWSVILRERRGPNGQFGGFVSDPPRAVDEAARKRNPYA